MERTSFSKKEKMDAYELEKTISKVAAELAEFGQLKENQDIPNIATLIAMTRLGIIGIYALAGPHLTKRIIEEAKEKGREAWTDPANPMRTFNEEEEEEEEEEEKENPPVN